MKECMHVEGFRVEPGVFPKELLRAWSATKLVCPFCREPVRYRHGSCVTPHFSHLSHAECDCGEPETWEHHEGKRLLQSWLERVFPSNVTMKEYDLKEINQRADIMTIFPDGHRLCIEYQCSPVSEDVLSKRMDGYEQAGISQLWVLGDTLFKGRAINRFRLHAWENKIRNRQENGLYLFDPTRGDRLVHLAGIKAVRRKKTIFTSEDRVEWQLGDLGISRYGTILFPDGWNQRRKRKSENESQIMRTAAAVPNMEKWILGVKRERERDFESNPLRTFVLSRIGDRISHPVFNQRIEGDYLFLLDHRLWQSYLFLTEIHKIYQRRAVYGTGTKIPTVFIKYILTKDNRFPERPFQYVLDRYVNKHLQSNMRHKPFYPRIKTIHELVYEYFCRLEMLGFLKNVTPSQEGMTPARQLYGKFEVLFDRFYPEVFGDTEEEIKAFFHNHSLRYVRNQWYDNRNHTPIPSLFPERQGT